MSAMSIGRGMVTMIIGLLAGTFVSATVSMITGSTGVYVSRELNGLIVLAVMILGCYPIHRLAWKRYLQRDAAIYEDEAEIEEAAAEAAAGTGTTGPRAEAAGERGRGALLGGERRVA
jgi:hypothetical protein